MSKYLSANFDRERGDALTITREEAVAFREVGKEIGATILWALVAEWFAGNPGDPIPKLKDPRDQRDLARLIEHQKANVAHHIVTATNRKRGGDSRWGNLPDTPTDGDMQMHTQKCKCIQGDANAPSKDKDKVSSSTKLESLPMINNVSPSGVANVAPPGGGTFARTATDKDGKTYHESDFGRNPIEAARRFVDERQGESMDYCDIEAECNKKLLGTFYGTIKKRAQQLSAHPGAFVSTCFDIVAEYCEITRKMDDVDEGSDAWWQLHKERDGAYGEGLPKTIMRRLKDKAIGLGLAEK